MLTGSGTQENLYESLLITRDVARYNSVTEALHLEKEKLTLYDGHSATIGKTKYRASPNEMGQIGARRPRRSKARLRHPCCAVT